MHKQVPPRPDATPACSGVSEIDLKFLIAAEENCNAVEQISTAFIERFEGTNLSEPVHSSMVTDSNNPFISYIAVAGCAGRIMDHYWRCSRLNNMDGNIERATESKDLRFTSPFSSIPDRLAIVFEFLGADDPSVESAWTIFTGSRR